MNDGKGNNSGGKRPVTLAGLFRWAVVKKVLRITLGVILIILGLAALVTPFTPGSWLALVGLEFLGLRILLRDRACAWAAARPSSKFRRAICRAMRVDGVHAIRQKWQERRSRRQP